MTHQQLIKRAKRWLKNSSSYDNNKYRCPIVLSEFMCWGIEIPDALGFYSGGSYLIECKTSRADFFADAKKFSRCHPEHGIGNYRYYMTEPGLLSPDELPENWGLLEASGSRVCVIKIAEYFKNTEKSERPFFYSALRRSYN